MPFDHPDKPDLSTAIRRRPIQSAQAVAAGHTRPDGFSPRRYARYESSLHGTDCAERAQLGARAPYTSESRCHGVGMSEALDFSNDPQDHGFDRVAVREACCNPVEFLKVRAIVQKHCDHRNKCIGFKRTIEIIFHPDKDGASLQFRILGNGSPTHQQIPNSGS